MDRRTLLAGTFGLLAAPLAAEAQHGDRTGDVIELETEGLGRLRFNVRDDLKRTWARETRLERQEKKLEPATTPQLSGKYTPSPKTADRAG